MDTRSPKRSNSDTPSDSSIKRARTTSKILTDSEVNEKIQSKFCKVISEYGEGTGYIFDDEKGMVLSSFHLVGAVKTLQLQYDNNPDLIKICGLLYLNGYMERDFRLTTQALQVTSEQNINLELKSEKSISSVVNGSSQSDITLKPDEIKDIVTKYNIKHQLFNLFTEGNYKKQVGLLSKTVEIQYDGERLQGEINLPILSEKILKNYAYFDAVPIKITFFEDGSSFSSKHKIINTGEKIDPLPQTESPLKIGEKIYFGGYPLTQKEYTFSTGMISAFTYSEKRTSIVIEAPIAPGNSGSPVFLQRNGKVYSIGIITSEVAHVSEKILDFKKNLQANRTEIIIEGQTRAADFGLMGSIRETIETLLNNLSTGKGKATEIRNIETLYNENFVNHDELVIDQFLDFLVPKKKHDIKQQKIKLFEYINQKKLTRLGKEDIIDYLNNNADQMTRQVIFYQISQKAISPESFISFPPVRLTEDQPLPEDNRIFSPDLFQRQPLSSLYRYALSVSQDRIIDGQYNFNNNDNIPIRQNTFVTQKFFCDHIGGGNRREAKEIADEVAERRNISVSSTIPENSLYDINIEIQNSQNNYKQAHVETRELAVGGLKNLFFRTENEYPLQVRSDQLFVSQIRSSFFYATIKKDNMYYMHHFEGTEAKSSWVALNVEDSRDNSKKFTFYATFGL